MVAAESRRIMPRQESARLNRGFSTSRATRTWQISHLPELKPERETFAPRPDDYFDNPHTNHRQHVVLPERPVLRQEEDRHRCCPLQAGPGPHQGQRPAHLARPARDPQIQGLRACPHPRPRQVRYAITYSPGKTERAMDVKEHGTQGWKMGTGDIAHNWNLC